MMSPLSKVLFKVFVQGFYKTHSGLLVFLFVTLISYCFFIQVLNETHLTNEESIRYNFIIVLNFISSPTIASAVFVIWLFWTFKTWEFISVILKDRKHHFLYYSANAFRKRTQLQSWFYVQMLLSAPILIYAGFSLIAGVIVGDFIIPSIFIFYIVMVSMISAIVYVRWVNHPVKTSAKNWLGAVTVSWNKPFYTLFLFHLFDRLKVPLVITKLLSYATIMGGSFLISRGDELQFGGIIVLGVVLSHALLIYQSYQFEYGYLNFTRNFPIKKIKIYSYWVITFLILTLPESLWIMTTFSVDEGLFLLTFSLATFMILRNILYTSALEMKKYIYLAFFLFIVLYFIILFGYIIPISIFNLLLSILIFESDYSKQKVHFNREPGSRHSNGE